MLFRVDEGAPAVDGGQLGSAGAGTTGGAEAAVPAHPPPDVGRVAPAGGRPPGRRCGDRRAGPYAGRVGHRRRRRKRRCRHRAGRGWWCGHRRAGWRQRRARDGRRRRAGDGRHRRGRRDGRARNGRNRTGRRRGSGARRRHRTGRVRTRGRRGLRFRWRRLRRPGTGWRGCPAPESTAWRAGPGPARRPPARLGRRRAISREGPGCPGRRPCPGCCSEPWRWPGPARGSRCAAPATTRRPGWPSRSHGRWSR